jgi:tRNA dimethylallyltransferase
VGRVLAIVGATAVGKSALALTVAERVGAEIVSADALQVYRGLDIGTAKPSRHERERVPHHLVDILEPQERFSAGRFARLARSAIEAILGRGRPAIVVGGSGLYLRALLDGMSPLPDVDPAIRDRLAGRLREDGLEPLRRELERLDPATAARLSPGDTQRTLRALEVVLSSGRPLSSWLADAPSGGGALPGVRRVGLTLPRTVLYDAIRSRIASMTDRGWLEEVRGLLARGVDPGAPAFQAIGYSQWLGHLAGEYDFEEATRRIVVATCRYAKRQETWFRREPDVEWHDARNGPSLASRWAADLEI